MSKRDIRHWMWRHVKDFVDECGEVNTTKMVEEWDKACDNGEATLDANHPAWDIAVDVADLFEGNKEKRDV